MIGRLLMAGIAAAATLHAGVALAVPVGMDAFSEEDVMIDFDDDFMVGGDDLFSGTILTNQYQSEGVVFVNSIGSSRANRSISALVSNNTDPNVIWNDQGGGSASSQNLELDFVAMSTNNQLVGVQQVGVQFMTSVDSDFTMEIYDRDDLLIESLTMIGTPGTDDQILEGFLGLSSSSVRPIFRAALSSHDTGPGSASFNFSIDDLRFTVVPEPGTAALMVLGLLGLALQGRRHS